MRDEVARHREWFLDVPPEFDDDSLDLDVAETDLFVCVVAAEDQRAIAQREALHDPDVVMDSNDDAASFQADLLTHKELVTVTDGGLHADTGGDYLERPRVFPGHRGLGVSHR